jgi:rhamnopyranosyl-N-acetylglucosaminyl-diphospho-decaprenol beta-1,3/1,4-galactofuranosyltransferase
LHQACSIHVLAIVLTYHAPASLARCLSAIGAQSRAPDGLLVIDNAGGSTATLHCLPQQMARTAQVVTTGENLGPAGGHAAGLAAFLVDTRFTHAWVMDDDCVPSADVLKHLVDAAGAAPQRHLVFPSWVDAKSGRIEDYPGWCGLLLDRAAVAAAGLPREDFFWWAEDTEYLQHRMPRHGVHIGRSREAVVFHEPVRRAAGRTAWKTYYEVRNSVYYRLYVQRRWPIGPAKLIRALTIILLSSLIQAGRREQLSMFRRGLIDGLLGRLGKRVRPPEPTTAVT